MTLEEAITKYTNAFKVYRNAARAYALALRDRRDGDENDPELVAKHKSTKAHLDIMKTKVSDASNLVLKLREEQNNEKKTSTR